MATYAFILGRNPELSIAELQAVFVGATVHQVGREFVVADVELPADPIATLERLGGTIKIAQVVGEVISPQVIVDELLRSQPADGAEAGEADKKRIRFGVSFYESRPTKIGFEVKGVLRDQGYSCRLVTSREQTLSSVIVAKERVQEFMILQNRWLAKTLAVQEFESYGHRDYGRPARDSRSGMLPPKLAKILINLTQAPTSATLLDPFCGSGTIVQEAVLLGFDQVIGTDISEKAIADSQKNLEWLCATYNRPASGYKLLKADARELSSFITTPVDVIATEPYLGPPLQGNEAPSQLDRIVHELSPLYLEAFSEFKKVLKPGGRVVIVFPWFVKMKRTLPIVDKLERSGWKRLSSPNLFFSRPGQHVWRQIIVFERA